MTRPERKLQTTNTHLEMFTTLSHKGEAHEVNDFISPRSNGNNQENNGNRDTLLVTVWNCAPSGGQCGGTTL